jgi:hypothetical protein
MAKRASQAVEMDLSSFMAVLIMTIGCMVVILVSNVIIIISNPENTTITSIVKSALTEGQDPFPQGNKAKEPSYIDVRRDRLVIYPGESIVPIRDLQLEGNEFEKLLDRVAANIADEYVVLLCRPGSVVVSRQLQKNISQRGIELGVELFEQDREVVYEPEK